MSNKPGKLLCHDDQTWGQRGCFLESRRQVGKQSGISSLGASYPFPVPSGQMVHFGEG